MNKGETSIEDGSNLLRTENEDKNNRQTNKMTTSNMNCTCSILTRSIVMVILAFLIGRLSVKMDALCHKSPLYSSSKQDIPQTDRTQVTNIKKENVVLITGATGRTGSLLYSNLVEKGVSVRALVRSVDKARDVLGCDSCDSSEGIFVGDVTRPEDLINAAKGVTTVAIAASASPGISKDEQMAVEFDGVINTVAALAQEANRDGGSIDRLRVVLCSSMGTSTPRSGNDHGYDISDILHWKLNAEAFIESAGVGYTIVKPCGLVDSDGGNSTLLVGHHDTLLKGDHYSIPRADVATVMSQAVLTRNEWLRFDLCSKPGSPTTDLEGLLESSKWEWQK